jgi:glycosyltransferase involved in cell wall biosynthesis
LEILRDADALLVHLKNDPLFNITIPSKIQTYLSIGKPILSGVSGDAEALIKDSESGLSFEPENIDEFVKQAEKLVNMSSFELEIMSKSAKEYYEQNLSFQRGVDLYETLFEESNNL